MHVSGIKVVRVLGEKGRTGWRPKRSLVFLSWGAEEYSLCGSRYVTLLLSVLIWFNENSMYYLQRHRTWIILAFCGSEQPSALDPLVLIQFITFHRVHVHSL